MGKHELALQHAMKALILIQDELITKVGEQEAIANQRASAEFTAPKTRLLCDKIAALIEIGVAELMNQWSATSYADLESKMLTMSRTISGGVER